MSSVVVDLQNEALSAESRVSSFLKKAHVVARKLEAEKAARWMEAELNGYGETGEVPWYRIVQGSVRTWSQDAGLQPVQFDDPKLAEFLSRRNLSMSVSGIENLLDGRTDTSIIGIPFAKPIEAQLMKAMKASTPPALIISYQTLSAILETVRTVVLNWAIRMEALGVRGAGLAFSEEERAIARIEEFDLVDTYGRSRRQRGSDEAEADSPRARYRAAFAGISRGCRELGLDTQILEEIEAELDTISSQLRSPRPKPVIINESLTVLRRIVIAAGGPKAAEVVVALSELSNELALQGILDS